MGDVIGLIPAAGYGTRLNSLGKETPKALLKIKDKSLIEIAIESLKSWGIKKIIIIVGHRGELIKNFLRDKSFGLDICYITQKEINGLPKAILAAEEFLDSTFVVYPPDNLLTDSQYEILKKHLVEKPNSTFIYEDVKAENERRNLVIEKNKIKSIELKREDIKYTIGLSIHEPDFLIYCRKVKKSAGGEYRMIDVLELLIKEGALVNCYPVIGKRINLTTDEDYYKYAEKIKYGKTSLYPGHLFYL